MTVGELREALEGFDNNQRIEVEVIGEHYAIPIIDVQEIPVLCYDNGQAWPMILLRTEP